MLRLILLCLVLAAAGAQGRKPVPPPEMDLHKSPLPIAYQRTSDVKTQPIMLLGIFSYYKQFKLRQLHRETTMKLPNVCVYPHTAFGLGRCTFYATFVIGISDVLLENEELAHNDITFLPIDENLNSGKSFVWFRYALRLIQHTNIGFIARYDDDTFFKPHALKHAMEKCESHTLCYMGTTRLYKGCGGHDAHCPPRHCTLADGFSESCWYFKSGALYAASYDLAVWIARTYASVIPARYIEDVAVGQWIGQMPGAKDVLSMEFHKEVYIHHKPPRSYHVFPLYYERVMANRTPWPY